MNKELSHAWVEKARDRLMHAASRKTPGKAARRLARIGDDGGVLIELIADLCAEAYGQGKTDLAEERLAREIR